MKQLLAKCASDTQSFLHTPNRNCQSNVDSKPVLQALDSFSISLKLRPRVFETLHKSPCALTWILSRAAMKSNNLFLATTLMVNESKQRVIHWRHTAVVLIFISPIAGRENRSITCSVTADLRCTDCKPVLNESRSKLSSQRSWGWRSQNN